MNLDLEESSKSGFVSRVIYCPRPLFFFKLIEMISVYFNTIEDDYYQDELSSSNCFNFFSFTGKKIVSSEVQGFKSLKTH